MLTDDDLRDVDQTLLDYLTEGRITPVYARTRLETEDAGEYSRGYVQQRLARLDEHDHAQNLLNVGLYELKKDPRTDAPEDDDTDLRGRLQNALEARDDQQARADRLEERVHDLETQLDTLDSSAGIDMRALERALDTIEAAAERDDGDAFRNALEDAREVRQDAE